MTVGVPLGGGGIRTLTGDVSAGPGSGSQAATLATVNASPGVYALATVTVDAKGRVTLASAAATTGSDSVVLATSPVIVTPTIASFTNATHNHQNAAGGGSLDAAAIGSGTLSNSRVNWAAPSAIGSGTPAAGTFTTLIATVTDASTNTVTDVTEFDHKSSGTPAANFGTGVVLRAHTDNNTLRSMARLRAYWSTAADGTRSAVAILSAFNTTEVDALTIAPAGISTSIALSATVSNVTTNSTANILTLGHITSSTPAANFGTGLSFQAHSSNNTVRDLAQIRAVWSVATDGSQTSNLILSTWNILVEKDAVTINELGQVGIGIAPAVLLHLKASSPVIRIDDSAGGANAGFMGQSNDTFALAVNRNPATGTITNSAKTSPQINLTGSAADGSITFYTSPTNNVVGTLRLTIDKNGIATHIASDAATNAVTNVLIVDHSTSGTPAASYGTGILVRGQSSTTVSQSMADVQASWVVATHASRTARAVFNVYDTAAREGLRIEASGSAPMIGFLGATAIARVTTAVAAAAFVANAGTAVNDASTFGGYTIKQIAQALVNYGLLT